MADGGYLVTAQADAALAAYDLPGVRHVAALDSGEGFVAYDGLLPDVSFADIARWLVPATHPDFWPWAAIKRKPPMLGSTEHLALISAASFRRLWGGDVLAATMIVGGDVLVQTPAPLVAVPVLWQASTTSWRDARVSVPA